ncbi:MAG: nucleoside monophosphate kinase [Rhodobacter sp.]|nr:nucleoside monophosphate kinase [Rhodobacter sp.]
MNGSTLAPPAVVTLPGPPDAGMETRARLPENDFGLIRLFAGDLPRAAMQAGTSAGRAAKETAKAGSLAVDDAAMIDRVSGRLACATCGKGCHDRFRLPAKAGVCARCGGAAFNRRADDTAGTLRARLRACHAQTAPMIAHYGKRGLLKRVDAMAPVADIGKTLAPGVARVAQ